MARKHKPSAPPEYSEDIYLPLSDYPSQASDPCFGKSWYALDTECSICAAFKACEVQYRNSLKQKEKELTDAHGPFLDMTTLPKDEVLLKLAGKVAEKQQAGEPLTVDRLTQFLMSNLLKTKDQLLADLTIKRMIELVPSVYIEEGKLLSKEV